MGETDLMKWLFDFIVKPLYRKVIVIDAEYKELSRLLDKDKTQLLQLREKKTTHITVSEHGAQFDRDFENMINQSSRDQNAIYKMLKEKNDKILELPNLYSNIDADKFPHLKGSINSYSESCKRLSDNLSNRRELQEYLEKFSKLNNSMSSYQFVSRGFQTNLSKDFTKFFKEGKKKLDAIVNGSDVDDLIAVNENLKNQCIEWASLTWWKKLWRALRGEY